MEIKESIVIDKNILSESVMNLTNKFDKLLQQNLLSISEQNKVEMILPINLSTVILLYVSYKFKIPIHVITALYQVYSNDLLVIILTILQGVGLYDIIETDCKDILHKLQTFEQIETMSSYAINFYNLIKIWKMEDSLYIPLNLW